ncbi:MAG: hypothetical protein ACOYNN_07890 [Terrimicrobiaceae bacterium]
MSPSNLAREIQRLAFLATIALLIWCGSHNRWSLESWQLPIQYGTDSATGDTKGMLATIKSASEGNFAPYLSKYQPNLGAPQGAFWDDMPITEQFLFWLPGLLVGFTGLFAAANLAVLIAQILAALSFYAVARVIGAQWTWAAAGALLFAFSRMASARMIHHLPVTFYWHVPLCLLVCYWIADGSLKLYSRKMIVALAIGVISGIQNPYYTAMFIQLAGLAALVPLWKRDYRVFLAAGAVAASAIVCFFSMNLPTFWFKVTHGPNPGAIVRNYQWLEFFALKPIDLVMPPPDHPFGMLRSLSQAYQSGVVIAGEVPPSGYLGIVGILALLWLLSVSIRNAISSPPRSLPMEAGQILYIAAFSIVGGLNGLAGVFGVHFFRSTNRYSIFILTIVLLFAAKNIPTSLRRSRISAYALPLLIAIVGLVDILPPAPTGDDLAKMAYLIRGDRNFVTTLEAALPPKAMVFQLPFSYFPEASAPGLPAYEHFRPYLFSNSLKFSYGHVKGRGLEDWQRTIFEQPLPDALAEIQRKGFQAITIYRPAFQDNAVSLIAELEKAVKFHRINHADGTLTALVPDPQPSRVAEPSKP